MAVLFENGVLRQIVNYINGYKEGEWKGYYKNGQLWESGTDVRGKGYGEKKIIL